MFVLANPFFVFVCAGNSLEKYFREGIFKFREFFTKPRSFVGETQILSIDKSRELAP